MANIDFTAMSVDDLEKFIQGTDEEIQELRNLKREAHAVLDVRNAETAARSRLETMSDPERAALAQILEAEGIDTEEVVGEPGEE